MSLRRKLVITFGALAFLGLLGAGVSIWATLQWESTNEQLQEHYTRSLQADRIRAATFRAMKEVSDAVNGGDQNARQEFATAIAPIGEDFEVWTSLADTEDEQRQVEEVRTAYDNVVEDAYRVFDLVDDGRLEEATELAEGQLEEGSFLEFEVLTQEAVASDRENREVVRAQVEEIRRTAQLVLVIAAFGAVSLILLLAAYLASDLFRPLKEIEQALDDVGRGNLDRRIEERRADELGAVSQAFNRMVEAISRREQIGEMASITAGGNGGDGPTAWRDAPSRVTLHRLVSHLRSRISQLNEEDGRDGGHEQGELVEQLDQLSLAVARMTEFGFPLDLNLSSTDVRALLYRVFMRFQDEFAERAVSIEFQIAPEVDYVVVDRLKLREVVGELLRNALAALPERGGSVGLRSRISEDGTELLIEVADDGVGAEQSLIDEAFDPRESTTGRPRVGLALTKAIVEQHGGSLGVESEPGGGTYAQIRLPLRG